MATFRTNPHRLPSERYEGDETIHFVARIVGPEPLFRDPDVVSIFASKLGQFSERYGCWVPIYCFMPDHLHAMVKGSRSTSRPKQVIDSFKISSGIWLSRKRPEYSWLGDYFDHLMRVGHDWKRHAFYILNNPVRAGLIEDPYEYPGNGCIGYRLEQLFHDLTD